MGNLWVVKGELPFERIPTLVNLTILHFLCNAAFRGTSQEDFGVHVTSLNSSHIRNINPFIHKFA